MIKVHIFLLLTGLGWFSLNDPAIAQIGRVGGGGFPGSVAGRSSLGGVQRFSPRAVNPNFNPRGSLSTFSNLNPRGSLSPALNLNPRGSLLRPRTGGRADSASGIAGTTTRFTAYKIPLAPNYRQLRILPRTSVSSWARISLQQFESSLSEYKNSEVWRSYLRLDKINSLLQSAADQPLTESSVKQLVGTLERFDTVCVETQYAKVKLLPGFRSTWTSLRDLVRADSGDERDRLVRGATALNRVLKERRGGKAWQEYLALPALIEAGVASDTDAPVAFRAACERTNARFEKILSSRDEYGPITDLMEFQVTEENLKSLLQKTEQPEPSS